MALLKNEMSDLKLKIGGGAEIDAEDTLASDLKTDLTLGELSAILIAYLVFFRVLAFVMLWKQGVKKTWWHLFLGLFGVNSASTSQNTKVCSTDNVEGMELTVAASTTAEARQAQV